MATVVNARDVLLQAASVRVATVTMASNLVVDQSQVTGLGVQVGGTKLVSLGTTGQAFLVPSVGAVSPSSVTLTATAYNLPAATLSVASGTVTPTPTLVNGSVTIPASNFLTDVVVLRISSTDGTTTYTDDVTFVKTYEGATSLASFLTNEISYMTADYLGNPLSYGGVNGTFKVYQGTSDITNLCTYALAPGGNPSNLAYVLNPANGTYSVTGGYPVATSSTTLTFRATFGVTTVDKVFTIRKTYAPAPSQRGSRTWYVGLTGTTNTYSDTLAATTALADGGPVLNDTVTQYNNAMGFSQTKFWNGTSWVIVNAIVDGNLLVSGTVGATALSANSVTATAILAGAVDATKITVTTLAAIQASLGTAQIDAAGYLRTAGATAYGTGAGVWMGWDAASTSYRFRVGNPTGSMLSWDGTGLVVKGDITGSTGTFGGSLSAGGGLFTVNGTTGAVSMKSATSGQRTEIANNVIKVFDAAGTLRVRLGDLTA